MQCPGIVPWHKAKLRMLLRDRSDRVARRPGRAPNIYVELVQVSRFRAGIKHRLEVVIDDPFVRCNALSAMPSTRFSLSTIVPVETKQGDPSRRTVLAARLYSKVCPNLQSPCADPILIVHCDEGWHLHQPAKLRQGGFHESGMWPFLRQI